MAKALTDKTVVICEDEGHTLMFLSRTLKRAGMNVLACVTDGRESVDQILRERPDVVLMDIKLPNLEGTEAIRRILATYSTYRPCIIMITAYGDEHHRRESAEAGAQGFVDKPFGGKAVLAEIRRVLEEEECGAPESEDNSPT